MLLISRETFQAGSDSRVFDTQVRVDCLLGLRFMISPEQAYQLPFFVTGIRNPQQTPVGLLGRMITRDLEPISQHIELNDGFFDTSELSVTWKRHEFNEVGYAVELEPAESGITTHALGILMLNTIGSLRLVESI